MENTHNARVGKQTPKIVEKSLARTRMDVLNWNQALNMARKADNPRRHLIHNLYDEIMVDALLMSQVENRRLMSLSQKFIIRDANGEGNEELTNRLQTAKWFSDIIKAIIDSRFYGHSLVELDTQGEGFITTLFRRQNIEPRTGRFFPDYTDEGKFVPFRELNEYGTWILEFGDNRDLGLLNNAVPHVLFKRFAESAWSELCEIFGIPPRVLKTNTQDRAMVNRAEKMLIDQGAAAWFIIDDSEHFEFADTANTTGDVYKGLMQFANSEISMLISGAIVAQDTVNGNRSKDESAREVLQQLINSDLSFIEQNMNDIVMPALVRLGVATEGLSFAYPETQDLEQLWKITHEALPFFEVDPEWVTETFGIKVTGNKQPQQQLLSANPFFD
ncbi:MAG: DUF935 domain-containing protein [Bacteroidetes bacterium]|nr:DUF935 domain-containing protein [Bacteroidota bacterium]